MAPLSPPMLTHLQCKTLQTKQIQPVASTPLKDGTQSLVMHHHKYTIMTTIMGDQQNFRSCSKNDKHFLEQDAHNKMSAVVQSVYLIQGECTISVLIFFHLPESVQLTGLNIL